MTRALALALLLATALPESLAHADGPPPLETRYREAMRLQAQQDFKGAAKALREVLRARKRKLGPKDASLIQPIEMLGHLAEIQGDYPAARRLFQQALSVSEAANGREHLTTARLMDRVAYHYWLHSDWRRGAPLLEEALAIHEELLPPNDPRLATYYDTQASYYKMRHAYTKAERLFRKALAIRETLTGPMRQLVMSSYYQLGFLAWARGQFTEAEGLFRKVLAIMEGNKGYQVGAASVLETIARIYEADDRHDGAKTYWDRAGAIYVGHETKMREQWGDNHAVTASAWSLLANHYVGRGAYRKALPWLRKALGYYRGALGETSAATGAYAIQLGMALEKLKQYDEARRILKQSLAIEEGYRGKIQSATAGVLLAELEYRTQHFERARKLMLRVEKARAQQFGERHPYTAQIGERLARLDWARGRAKRAVKPLARALESYEHYIALVMDTGSEQDKQKYLAEVAEHLDLVVSLNLQGLPDATDARALALSILLQRKGRVLDAVADTFGALRQRLGKEDQKQLEALASARARLGTLVLKGPGSTPPAEHAREIAELETTIRRLEQTLGSRDAGFRAARTPVNVGTVSAALPKDTALVEWTLYRPIDPKAPSGFAGEARYAAYVLHPDGRTAALDLGPAAAIDSVVERFREAVASPERDDVTAIGSALDALVFRKVRRELGNTTNLFVAPDGALNLVPFGALTDERGQFIVQRYTLTYLTSGRDLIRLQAQAAPRSNPVVVANPRFDSENAATASATPSEVRGMRSTDLHTMKWGALPATADEAKALGGLLQNVRILTGEQASEAALKALRGPSVLHIATHGFFLPPQKSVDPTLRPPENPLLRSGLALSGANAFADGDEDGVLTALEASSLDLYGTDLVVLSACETGVGAVRGGEGVYGLRRALVIAGAETQVMSLWQVDDEATRDLMIAYYKRLEGGKGRSAALRQAQLRLVTTTDRQHPFYWASFITSGAWTPIAQKADGEPDPELNNRVRESSP